ncbi:MAG: hypothetical protein AB9869_09500 [Verrucomicrobiia bacterium]
MKRIQMSLKSLALALAVFSVGSGCESTNGDGHASAGAYYGVGFYDPWYYGDYDNDVDVIVTPPDRPAAPPRPSHPIATPPSAGPRPTPMPSIPSMPRASFRR